MRINRMFLLAVAMFSSFSAFAVDDDETDNHGKPKARYELGAQVAFVTVNPILGNYYDDHESVNGFNFGPVLTRRSEDGNSQNGLGYTHCTFITVPMGMRWVSWSRRPFSLGR